MMHTATTFQTILFITLAAFVVSIIDKYLHLSDYQPVGPHPGPHFGPAEFLSEEPSAGAEWLKFFGYLFATIFGLVSAIVIFIGSLLFLVLVGPRVKQEFSFVTGHTDRRHIIMASGLPRDSEGLPEYDSGRGVLGEYTNTREGDIGFVRLTYAVGEDMSISAVTYRTWAAEDAKRAKLQKEDPAAYRRLITPEVKPRRPRRVVQKNIGG